MLCTNCGARILDTDQFCPKCGAKAIKDMRCPDCGEVLREGTVFCHRCGRQIGGGSDARKVPEETLDIPIDAIERNILSETAAEIKADHRSAPRSSTSTRTTAAPAAKKSSAIASSSGKKNVYHEEEEWEDDWDEEEDSVDIITIMTAVVGCVLLVVIAVLGYHLYRQYAPGNYEREAESSEDEGNTFFDQEAGEEQEQGQVQELEQTLGAETSGRTVTVIKNVNVRDNPSTSDSNVLKVAKEGEVYPYRGNTEDDEWYEILLEDGSVGYVYHEYVTVD